MGLKCVCCGYVATDLEDLLRHRLSECEHEDPIGPVQAPWLPPRNVTKVGEPCYKCRCSLEEYDWDPEGSRPLHQPGDVFNNCDNAKASRCESFFIVVAKYKRAIAQYRHERGTGPPAPAPRKKRAKKSDKTTKR